MAWRFKASKYKNAAPFVPKLEHQIRDLSIGSYRSHGNFIAASAAYMAFNWDTTGSNLAVLPLDTKGRQNKANMPLIYAHSEFVTDFQFSPFDDGLLATGSQDLTVKLWRIPASGMPSGGLSSPELTLPQQPRRVETVNFHPTADCVLATSSATSVNVWDLVQAQELYSFNDHDDEVQCVSWQTSGQLFATQCKDRQLRVFDPRQDKVAAQCDSHQGIKDSKVVWVGSQQRILTTGFSADRIRELNIHDLRNMSAPQKNLTLDMSSGILVPLFDPDTNMCFLCGKGDRNIQFVEITDKDPYIVEGLKYSGDQTKGACLVPKRSMDVMQGEVNRVLQLCDSSVVPVTWQVPRKSYRDYHADIYPETSGLEPSMGPGNWWSGCDAQPGKINLDPKKRPQETLTVFGGPLADRPRSKEVAKAEKNGSVNGGAVPSNGSATNGESSHANGKTESAAAPTIASEGEFFEESMRKSQEANAKNTIAEVPEKPPMTRTNSDEENKENKSSSVSSPEDNLDSGSVTKPPEEKVELRKQSRNHSTSTNPFLAKDRAPREEEVKPKASRPASKMFGRVSKFKHLKGDVMLKGRFENLKNLSKTIPVECDFVHANAARIAVPLTGPGGKLAVFETSRPGRIADGVTPVLINGTTVMDFAFDPFDLSRLAVACDDGYLRIWKIPDGGLVQQVNEPDQMVAAHADKVQIVQFHPLAKDVLITAAFDRTVKIWDLGRPDEALMELEGHTDQLYSVRFSPCGRFVATVCRDGKIRIFDPRQSSQPIREGGEIVAKKGARVVWVLHGEYLVITGFSRQSERQVMVYRTNDLQLMNTVTLDVSPAIMIPHYDADSSTLFLTGKGESTVPTFEVSTDAPHLFALSPYKPSGLHQGFSFLPKNVCDVRQVEFARAFRLTNTTIEPVSFSVPRVKTAFFQDDLFPDTRVMWEPTMTAEEWANGSEKTAAFVSLKPDDMKNLTSTSTSRASTASNGGGSNNANNSNNSSNRSNLPGSVKEEAEEEQGDERSQSQRQFVNSLDREETKAKEHNLEQSVNRLLGEEAHEGKLEQDLMEGADEEDWAEK